MDPFENLHGKRVLVAGAAKTGLAVTRFLHARGAEVILTDAKSAAQLGDALKGLPAGVRLELGPPRAATFAAADLIVLSPGVPPQLPEVIAAQQAGVPVTGELELAARFIEAPIVAITGTNGKSTVTSLCGEIAKATGRPAFVGGNLGTPLVEAVGTEAASARGIVVCECSSFQLETAERFRPRAAVLLNVTPDHLDRHGTMADYAAAKMRIARNLRRGDVFVMNEDDPEVLAAWDRHAGGFIPTTTYSTRGRPKHRFVVSDGSGAVEVEAGGFVEEGALVLRIAGERGRVTEERYATEGLALVGRHNMGNALAAFLAMRASGLAGSEAVREGAARFRPLPHRMELVGERGGVRFYDDSKGTNVAAVVASIDGFPRPYFLIAGGRDKGGSYAPLREALQGGPARGVIVIGESADLIAAAVEGAVPVHRAASMHEAVAIGATNAHAGDAVILSPACSSFDMFKDYKHRGRVFREAVEALP